MKAIDLFNEVRDMNEAKTISFEGVVLTERSIATIEYLQELDNENIEFELGFLDKLSNIIIDLKCGADIEEGELFRALSRLRSLKEILVDFTNPNTK